MIPPVSWPSYLPSAQLAGRENQVVSPIRSARLASGRSRTERIFTAVPVERTVSWVMTNVEAQLFASFFKRDLVDGTLWFSMELLLPEGRGPWPFKFMDVYSGEELVGRPGAPRWRYTARLEQWLRPQTAFPPWIGDYPDWVPFLSRFDILMNDTWPEA